MFRAFVGAMASDFLGDYETKEEAVYDAKFAGYRFVSLIDEEGNTESVPTGV